jgi:hypothetical protein
MGITGPAAPPGVAAERLARPGAKLGRDLVEVFAAVRGEAGALRVVLAQQRVGVLVAEPLPRAGLFAEVHSASVISQWQAISLP